MIFFGSQNGVPRDNWTGVARSRTCGVPMVFSWCSTLGFLEMKKPINTHYVGVSKNNGTPKSSILIGISIINHLFWGPTPIFGNTHIGLIVSGFSHFPGAHVGIGGPHPVC